MTMLFRTIKNTTYTILTLAIMLTSLASSVQAQSDEERYTSSRILVAGTDVKPGETITIATEITLAPDWHVYWKNPGDSGLPVRIDWTLPEGFEIGEIQWPTPDKVSYEILVNYGYYNRVTLLQELTAPDTLPEGALNISAKLEMLVCNEICIPESDTISASLNTSTDNRAEIAQAKTKLPQSLGGTFEYHEHDNAFILEATLETTDVFTNIDPNTIDFFPVEWGVINYVEEPQVTIDGSKIIIRQARSDRPLSDLSQIDGVLVIKSDKKGESQGFEISAIPQVKEGSVAPLLSAEDEIKITDKQVHEQTSGQDITWFSALYLAVLGGLILNLMPCVFPVLSMKALSLVKMRDQEKTLARLHGIAYTIGVVLSFLIIGGIFIILKEAGSSVGWGFQFQNPVAVAALAYLLFIIGLNLIGFFDFGSGFSNVGNKLTQGSSISSSFFTGALATIVATPCTAPYMGVVMGYAATQNAFLSMSVFAALGLGLALPYLALCFIPTLQKILPKPGAWMNTFKQFLAFPMFGATIWLVWVVSQQAGSYGVLLVLLGMLSIAFCVWLSHLHINGNKKAVTRTLFILCMLLPISSLLYIKTTEIGSCEAPQIFEQEFSHEALDELLKGDTPVFVEMTAAWCITCKFNHATAINIQTTKDLFKEHQVEYLVGDWTNRSDKITEYLKEFGRNGVPLYVYYGPRDTQTGQRPKAVVLPQVLTKYTLRDTIE